jgi:hypothetical protein
MGKLRQHAKAAGNAQKCRHKKGGCNVGKASQRKGRAGELELCRILQGYGLQAQPGQAVSFGNTPDITGLPGIHIECKRVEKLNIPAAFAQAARDSE